MKKIFICLALCLTILGASACTSKTKNVEGTLEEIMTKVYGDVETVKALTNIEITDENLEYYTGLTELDYKEAIASESQIGSFAHSVVLIRLNDAKNAEEVAKNIKEKVNPAKWICVNVEKENVYTDNIGDLVILVMNNDVAEDLLNNFKALGN